MSYNLELYVEGSLFVFVVVVVVYDMNGYFPTSLRYIAQRIYFKTCGVDAQIETLLFTATVLHNSPCKLTSVGPCCSWG